jgi:hypothetical protein
MQPWDVDYSPTGTAFGIRWSPWVAKDSKQSAVIAYLDQHYIGFRRVTVEDDEEKVIIDEANCTGGCVHLSTDAFVEWEERVRVDIWPVVIRS